MQRFTFPLEAVLRLRRQRVEQAEEALTRLQAELRAVHDRQQALEREVREAEAVTEGTSTGDRWQRLDQYRRHASRQRQKLAGEAAACLERIGAQQKVIVEARRDEELVLRLKKKRRERWEKEAGREEQALAEEVFMSQWGRQ